MRILFVENNATFAGVVIPTFLAEHEVTLAPSIERALKLARSETYDAALVDYDLDDGKGDAVVAALRAQGFSNTIVGVSSHAAGNAALRKAGADSTCSKLAFEQIGTHLRPPDTNAHGTLDP